MKIILLDESKERLVALRRLIACADPTVEITEYDLDQQGEPGSGFDWSLYDLLIIERPPEGGGALGWLARRSPAADLPPMLVLGDAGDDYTAAQAIRLGAAEYLRREDITAGRLAVLAARGRDRRPSPAHDATVDAGLAADNRIIEALAPRGREVGYRFVRLIGQGAASRVYLAEQATDRRSLVLKIIDLESGRDSLAVQRFVREAELIASVASPYVVRFHDHGFTPRYAYIAMEFFTRGDLKQRIERGVAPADAVNYMMHLVRGLAAIHALGIVHRDVKPGNIMFRSDDSLALADFGIARRLEESSDLTRLGSVLGTPNYLSPEQAQGRAVDARADLYSAGVVFYELLTGRKPYRADSALALAQQHVHAPIPRLPAAVARFQPLVDFMLAKSPGERFESAGELLDALRSFGRLPAPGGPARALK